MVALGVRVGWVYRKVLRRVNKLYTLALGHTEPMVVYNSLDSPSHFTVDLTSTCCCNVINHR